MAVELGWPSTDRRFRAMGTECHIVVVGPGSDAAADQAVERVKQLEQLWSRFLPESEIARLNRKTGEAMPVSPETIELVDKAIVAWELTDGAFDPTMEQRLVDLGYDRPFDQVAARNVEDETQTRHTVPTPSAARAAGCARIVVDRAAATVELPAGVGFDPGGIGKGLAADMVAAEAVDAGAWGAMVNLGGDLRVIGTPPSGDAWTVAIAEPAVLADLITNVRLSEAALATSTTRRRTWSGPAGVSHHLLNPDTGLPQAGGPELVSVIAGEAWWAEAAATAIAASGVSPTNPPSGSLPEISSLCINADGSRHRSGDFGSYETGTNIS